MKLPELKVGNLTAKLPIIQGGMGVGVSLSGLASAVANEGGIGVLSGVQIGFREPDFESNPVEANLRALKSEIKKAREKSPNGIIGVNFMTVLNHYDEYVKEAVKNKIDLIISGAGLPMHLPKLVAGSDVKIMPIVSSARALKLILKSWLKAGRLPDGIVVEGPLAGGHLGFKYQDMIDHTNRTLEEALIEVKELVLQVEAEHAVTIPVIAAGGIASHEDICRMLELGAAGVQMGTRFVVTDECDASQEFKDTYLRSKDAGIRIIKSPVGLAARAINNEFLEAAYQTEHIPVQKCYRCMSSCNPAETHYCISKALIDSANGNGGLIFSGGRADELDRIISVHELMKELAPDNEDHTTIQ